jgi:hypothetical protein
LLYGHDLPVSLLAELTGLIGERHWVEEGSGREGACRIGNQTELEPADANPEIWLPIYYASKPRRTPKSHRLWRSLQRSAEPGSAEAGIATYLYVKPS